MNRIYWQGNFYAPVETRFSFSNVCDVNCLCGLDTRVMSLVAAVFTVPLIHFFTILVSISLGNKIAIYLTTVCEQNLLAGKFLCSS